uniref:Ninein n=1 Tax=Callorhinchus milii TaxID=7868 RepID=A0A4W3IC35_CALMI
MDEAEQDKYEARLKEVFDSFDTTGTGSLGQEELTDLCHMLQLQEVAPVLLQTLLQGNLSGRVHFEQFKEALILILSTTIEGNFSGDDGYQEPESTEVQPKYVKDGKRYGRRTAPEFQDSVEEFTEVKVTEPIADGLGPEDATSVDVENWKTSTDQGEEYEAEGQLRFWNPDDLNSCQSMFSADPDWIEERLQAVCEELGVTRDDYPSRKELISICDQIGLQNVDTEVLEELVQKQEQDGLLTVEDFFYGLFKNGQSAPPSASTPYRQLKRHHSLQPFDESGRRTATPSAMTGTIGLRLFSCLDDGTGYTSADQILDAWQEGGIENGLEILKTLDFGPDGKVNLTELTLALENELLITKNGIHQAVLASFKHEIRHLMERVDQVLREKEKLHTDLDKADRLKNLMASEVDDHHAAIERLNECNLRKLEQEHRERLAALKADLTKEKDLILQQASRQSSELEKEIEKVKAEESYLRDRLALSLKENSRLERELLENGEKLVGFENQAKKLQKNLDNVLKEKFGDLDPTSAEFFLHEERFSRLRREYEQQCRELQDRIDELQSELQAYQTQDKSFKQLWGSSLSDEMENKTGAIDCDQGLQSEECNPLNLSLEAEMVIEQIKEQHHQAFESLKVDLETKVRFYEAQIEETKLKYETEEKIIKQKCKEDILQMEKQIDDLKSHISKLQGETEFLKMLQQTTEYKCEEEKRAVQDWFHEEKRQLQEQFKQKHEDTLRIKLDEERRSLHNEKEMLLEKQKSAEIQIEAQRKELIETFLQERAELQQIYEAQISKIEQNMTQEKEELQRDLLEEKQKELCEERKNMENDFNQKISEMEAQYSNEHQKIMLKLKAEMSELEQKYKQEIMELRDQLWEEKGQWEFEKEEILQENEEEKERLKDALENKIALLSRTIAQERELVIKSGKEEVNMLASKNQQLQKELEELQAATSSRESKLSNELICLKKEMENQLQVKDKQLIEAEGKWEQSRASAQAHVSQEEFEKERAELRSEISRLQETTKDMFKNAVTLCAVQKINEELVRENQAMNGKISQLQEKGQKLEKEALLLAELQTVHEQVKRENEELGSELLELQERTKDLEGKELALASLQNAIEILTNEKSEIVKQNAELLEKAKRLEEKVVVLTNIRKAQQEFEKERAQINSENVSLKERIRELEEKSQELSILQTTIELLESEKAEIVEEHQELQEKGKRLEDKLVFLTDLEKAYEESERERVEVSAENVSLKESTKELEEKVLSIPALQKKNAQTERENVELKAAIAELQAQSTEMQHQARHLVLNCIRYRVVTCTISYVKLTLPTVLKTFVPNCTPNQMAETRSRNRQLDAENENLCRKNSKNQADVQDLNRRLADLLRQKEKKMDRQLLEEWELEKSQIMEEMENSRAEVNHYSALMHLLMSFLSLNKLNSSFLFLQLSECNRLESEVTSLKYTNEKLIQEKETLSDEVNRCVDRVWKSLNLRQEQQTLQQQIHMLTTQLNMSQEKIQSLEETLQNAHFQAARCKSDFRVSQQEKEALKQEVTSFQEMVHASGRSNETKKKDALPYSFLQQIRLYRDDLARLVEKEQQLLRQENERLQREAQHTKGELQQAREKIKYLDSTLLTLKQQKHYNKSAMVKAAEQEKLSLKRECDQIQKELLSANRKVRHKINKGNIFFLSRNIQLEGQRSKRVSKELLQANSSLTFSQSQNIRELQQLKEQVCGMVPQEQVTQLQQRLSHEEMQRRQLQEQLDKHAADSNTQQVRSVPSEKYHSFEQWENFNNNFALQMSKNIKADEMIKDLYVENAQLLKALEMSEQRHKTTEKKNYLLEENIAGLNKILKDLSTSSLSAASARYSS